jgi:hypothetical protein
MMSALCLSGLSVAAEREEEWVECGEEIRSTGNLTFFTAWSPGTGVHLRVTDTNRTRAVEIALAPDSCGVSFVPKEAFPLASVERSRFDSRALPQAELPSLELILKIRQEDWSVYCGERCVAVIPAPLVPPFVLYRPRGELPRDGAVKPAFRRVGDFKFSDSFMRAEEEPNQLGEWDVVSGAWNIHTVELTPARDRERKREGGKKGPKSEFSSNFYSLAGRGSNAVITAGYDFYDAYSLEAGVSLWPGEMGLVFHHRDSGACHGFTLRMGENAEEALLTLWSRTSSNDVQRTMLAAAEAKITSGQWTKLGVRTFLNRVQCFMDNQKVFDLPVDLSPGGRFGLFVSSEEDVRFDDVAAESNHDLDLSTAGDVRGRVLAEDGAFLPRRRFLGILPPRDDSLLLSPPESGRPQRLILGSETHASHVFSADFEIDSPRSSVGILAGWTGDDAPHFRFTRTCAGADEIFLLESLAGGKVETLEKYRLGLPRGRQPVGRVNLMFDASGDREWRLYRNGEMVLFHFPAPACAGASGLYVGGRTRARISIPEYRFERRDLYRNRYEKNDRFSSDPFMRHWASPEGQWIEERNRLTWYTGDFFGRFSLRMPCVDQSQVHLFVGESSTNGELVVSVQGRNVSLLGGPDLGASRQPLEQAPISALAGEKEEKGYTIQNEGRWVWLTSGNALLFKHSIEAPMKGRRVRASGFTTEHLKKTYVERFNVKDFLFTESIFDWTVNGGSWEVVNRFQCDPRWSHMNGVNDDGLAAMWAKCEISGDFCVEMYAGQRHGWYERCGDLNMTVMNRDTTPGQGYTITCTGWDVDHSQLYTTLYRNGVPMARSDKYLAPRSREGNKRFGYEPLLADGRPVHGAWYYMKFRRVGRRLEYYFDNEPVFSLDDPEPLGSGSAGIWTFMNSMMVARVKIGAESIRPRSVEIRPVGLDSPILSGGIRAGSREPTAVFAPVVKDGNPLQLCAPACWEADDPVSRLRLDWHDRSGSTPYFVARNVMGSGTVLAKCLLPPVPLGNLAGWRFDVKRTPMALFNFCFTTGRKDAKGDYTLDRWYFHRISGADPEKGAFIKCGETDVAPVARLPDGDSPWTPVTVWIYGAGGKTGDESGRWARIEGFGSLQPGLELQGIAGNPPGECYAVRDLTEVRYRRPVLDLAGDPGIPLSVAACISGADGPRAVFTNAAGLQAWVNAVTNEGLVTATLTAAAPGSVLASRLCWVNLPDQPAVTCSWSDAVPDAVTIRCGAPYPDRRFLDAGVSIGNVAVDTAGNGFGERTAAAPRIDGYGADPLRVTLRGAPARVFDLQWKDNRERGAPVLLSIDGITPFLQNCEKRDIQLTVTGYDPARHRIEPFDREQGSYLRIMNNVDGNRLVGAFPVSLSLARYPLFQFKYRTDEEMTRVTLDLGDSRRASVSEELAGAVEVRGARKISFDGKWHTWFGDVSDTLLGRNLSGRPSPVHLLRLGSVSSTDQTGFRTCWDLDDLAFGPAVSSADQLAFVPHYFDFTGIESVRMAVRPGAEPFDELAESQRAALSWRPVTNGFKAFPGIAGLADGVCRLFIKARANSGMESAVTDVPFLLDRVPMHARSSFEETDDPLRNGTELRVVLTLGEASRLDADGVRLKLNGTEMTGFWKGTRVVHRQNRDILEINWPYVFRDWLDASTNGQTATIAVTGLQDGAGNRSFDVSAPLTVDYAGDHTAPTVLGIVYSTDIVWRVSWDAPSEAAVGFTAEKGCGVELVRKKGEDTYLKATSEQGGGITAGFDANKWPVKDFPCLALRIRGPDLIAIPTNACLSLDIGLSSGQTVILPLACGKAWKGGESLPKPIAWKSNVWESVFLNLPEVITNSLPRVSLSGLAVKSVAISPKEMTSRLQFHVRDVFAFAPVSPEAKIDAYDASGMDSAQTAYESDGEGESSAEAVQAEERPRRGWQMIRARDKAGNLSLPVRVPVWDIGNASGGGG